MMKQSKRLVVLLLVVLMAVYAWSPQAVSAEEGPRDLSNVSPPPVVITASEFSAWNGGIRIGTGDLGRIPLDASIELYYEFEVDNDADVFSGDFFEIELPAELVAITDFPTSWSDEFYDDQNDLLGTIRVVGNKLRIVFADGIESASNVHAGFLLSGDLVRERIDTSRTITFSLTADGTSYTIGFEPPPAPDPDYKGEITKRGSYNPSTNTITWTVTVKSTGKLPLPGATVVDELGTLQSYVGGSTVGLDQQPTANGEKLTFNLGQVDGTKSFSFETQPTESAFAAEEGGKTNIPNEVELYREGEPGRLARAQANVSITTDWIQKTGTARMEGGVQYIDWTIWLNNNLRAIPAGSIWTDTLNEFHEYDSDTIARDDSKELPTADRFDVSGQKLTYTFGEAVTKRTKLTFTTIVRPQYWDQQEATSIANGATITIGGTGYSAEDSVGVGTTLLTKVGDGYNPATKEITWKLVVNGNNRQITNARITDTIPAGQEFIDGSVRVAGALPTKLNQLPTEPVTERSYFFASPGTLDIFLGNLAEGSDPIVVTFVTRVTNAAHYAGNYKSDDAYTNSAILTGVEITTASASSTQTVESIVLEKAPDADHAYDYDTRTFSWTITVNRNNMPMTNAVITDVIPDDQEYVPGSLRVGDSAPLEENWDLVDNTLIVRLGSISTQQTIRLQTKVADETIFMDTNGPVTFRNQAKLVSGLDGAPEVVVNAHQVVENEAVTKNLKKDIVKSNEDLTLDWEVFVNTNQVELLNAELHDTLAPGLELDTDSVKLWEWNQSADGTRSPGAQVPLNTRGFTFSFDLATRLFKIHLPNGAQGWYLTFTTDVIEPGTYSNTMMLAGEYQGTSSDSSVIEVFRSELQGFGSGTNGSITVTKVDQFGDPIGTGAEFALFDRLGNKIRTATTGSDGKLTFERLKLEREWRIEEVRAPIGFVLNAEPLIVTLTSDSSQAQHVSRSVTNLPITGSFRLKKHDTNGKPLSGGRFSVYAEADTAFANPLGTVTSGHDGSVVFTGLEAGTYVVREIVPPPGFSGTLETRTVTLTLDTARNELVSNAENEDPFINHRIPGVEFGSIRLEKVDYEGSPLAGAVFGLFNSYGGQIQTATSTEEGKVVFLNIPFGTYTVKEIEAPAGYLLTEQMATVNVTNALTVDADPFTFVNERDEDEADPEETTDGPQDEEEPGEDPEDPLGEGDFGDDPGAGGRLPQAGGFWDGTVLTILALILITAGAVPLVRRRYARR